MQSKSLIILAVGLGLAVIASRPASAQPLPVSYAIQEQGIAGAARQGLAEFAKQNQAEHGARLPDGFPLALADGRELASLQLGRGFPVYTVDPQRLLAAEADLSRLMTPTGSWRFVVLSGARPVGLVTVEKMDGRWQAISFGAAELARNVEAAQAGHGQTRFLRVYQAQTDFLEVAPAGGKPRFAALMSARERLSLQQQPALLDGADLIEPLRAAVRAGLASFR
ncbi:hypothetical protein [Chromobacterium violaceum]|uniref:Uncharacterized protein n=1 Tax=Chromobacterium violaceum (strain ATCC 12472 / DSM 30191 / JCM 1249 / CCUG 213 / NBRC 12614 / NCIMB 9131 / NCTC 9757 / MK) TaxID=243365 RepID=Q7NSN0_CHRVO|nr:hypothetical protein [Chromobacterium violaceum]AAQ61055.1 hypothetical protein CV_3391 [Chromobacterium violaceum ATCC 12472]SUX39522.1 Uncharacterised protein [Chromobacterium violaceum]